MLEKARVDFVDMSGGTFERRAFELKKESTVAREAYFIEFDEMISPHLKQTKVFVTGGFRTTAGMVCTVECGACDGVGIGRPLAVEPFLCKELLSGRVRGSIDSYVPLPLSTLASGSQLHQVGTGAEKISDWSDKEEVKRWAEVHEETEEDKAAWIVMVTRR